MASVLIRRDLKMQTHSRDWDDEAITQGLLATPGTGPTGKVLPWSLQTEGMNLYGFRHPAVPGNSTALSPQLPVTVPPAICLTETALSQVWPRHPRVSEVRGSQGLEPGRPNCGPACGELGSGLSFPAVSCPQARPPVLSAVCSSRERAGKEPQCKQVTSYIKTASQRSSQMTWVQGQAGE